jgi:hypothetical protein
LFQLLLCTCSKVKYSAKTKICFDKTRTFLHTELVSCNFLRFPINKIWLRFEQIFVLIFPQKCGNNNPARSHKCKDCVVFLLQNNYSWLFKKWVKEIRISSVYIVLLLGAEITNDIISTYVVVIIILVNYRTNKAYLNWR